MNKTENLSTPFAIVYNVEENCYEITREQKGIPGKRIGGEVLLCRDEIPERYQRILKPAPAAAEFPDCYTAQFYSYPAALDCLFTLAEVEIDKKRNLQFVWFIAFLAAVAVVAMIVLWFKLR